MKQLACWLLVALLLGCGRVPVQDKLLKSMAQLDRAYIPALFFADLSKQREAELSFQRLKNAWSGFYDKYYGLKLKYGVDIIDEYWQDDFDRAGALIASAESLIKARRLKEAALTLAPLQPIFAKLRHRHNLDYFLDRLIDFHLSLNSLTNNLIGKKQLTFREIERLSGPEAELTKKWEAVESSKINRNIYGFSSAKVGSFKKLLVQEKTAIAQLKAAVTKQDPVKVRQTVNDLRSGFAYIYRVFGDFQPIFDQVNKEKRAVLEKQRKASVEAEAKNKKASKGSKGPKKTKKK